MSLYKQRLEMVAGGFATMLVLLPWRHVEALAGSETFAALFTAGCLGGLSVLAFVGSRRGWARNKSYRIELFNESFEVSGLLHNFAFFAWVELTVALIAWGTYLYVDGPGSR